MLQFNYCFSIYYCLLRRRSRSFIILIYSIISLSSTHLSLPFTWAGHSALFPGFATSRLHLASSLIAWRFFFQPFPFISLSALPAFPFFFFLGSRSFILLFFLSFFLFQYFLFTFNSFFLGLGPGDGTSGTIYHLSIWAIYHHHG